MPIRLNKADVIAKLKKKLADLEDQHARDTDQWHKDTKTWAANAIKEYKMFVDAVVLNRFDEDGAPAKYTLHYGGWHLPEGMTPPLKPKLPFTTIAEINKLLERLNMTPDETVSINLSDTLNRYV